MSHRTFGLITLLLAVELTGCTATRTIFGMADQDVTPQPVPDIRRINFEFPLIKAPDGTTYADADLVALLIEPLTRSPESAGQVTVKSIGPGEFDIMDAYSSAPPITDPLPFLTTTKTEYHIDETIRLRVLPNADRAQFIVTADPRASNRLEYRYEVYSDGKRVRIDGLGDDAGFTRPDSPRFGSSGIPRKEPLATKLMQAAGEVQAGRIQWAAKSVSYSKSYDVAGPLESVAFAITQAFPTAGPGTRSGPKSGKFTSEGTSVEYSLNPKTPTATVLTLSLQSHPEWALSFEKMRLECLGCNPKPMDTLDPAVTKITRALELMAPPVMAAPPLPAAPPPRMCVVVSPGNANLREMPGSKSTLLKKLAKGTVGTQVAIESEWMKIELRGGIRGWVHRSLIEPTPCK